MRGVTCQDQFGLSKGNHTHDDSQHSMDKRVSQQVTFCGENSARNKRRNPASSKKKAESPSDTEELHLPYWERKAYRAYKQIKVVQPALDTSIQEYIDIKIDEKET